LGKKINTGFILVQIQYVFISCGNRFEDDNQFEDSDVMCSSDDDNHQSECSDAHGVP